MINRSPYVIIAWSQGDGDTWTAKAGYNLRENETDNNSNERLATEDQVISSATTTQALWGTTTSDAFAAAIASFRAATTSGSGGGATTTTASTTLRYVLTDHLGGTNVVTDTTGAIVETLDYYPYGQTRIDSKVGAFTGEKHKYAGTEYDAGTGLNYLNARYYSGTKGQFLSQDPAFLKIGTKEFEERYERTLQQHLMNPQALNSYSYGLNNPIINKDPEGEIVPLLIGAYIAAEFALSAYDAYSTASTLANPNASGGEKMFSAGGFVAGLALPGAGYGTAAKAVANKLPDAALVCRGGGCSASQFKNAAGASLDPSGKLQGVSVNSGLGASLKELTKSLPHNQIGVTTVGDVRKLGGDVVSTPKLNGSNPFHSILQGITPQQAENLFRPTVANPSKAK